MIWTIVAALIALLAGIAFCFYGLRVFMVFLPVLAFFGGFWLGAQAIQLLSGGAFLGTDTSVIVALILGVVFAVLAYFNFEAGVMQVTAAFGAAIAVGLVTALGVTSTVWIVAAAVLVAVVLVWLLFRYGFDRALVMVLMAISGASVVLTGILLLVGRLSLDTLQAAGNTVAPVLADSWLWSLLWIALAAAGILVQLRTSRDYLFTSHDLVQGWS